VKIPEVITKKKVCSIPVQKKDLKINEIKRHPVFGVKDL